MLLAALSDAAGCRRSPTYDYEVANYDLAFTLDDASPNAQVTMDLTYQVGKTPKKDGFKFVGNGRVSHLACFDAQGKPLECRVVQLREAKLEWYFPAVRDVRQQVRVTFVLEGFVHQSGNERRIDVPWAGVFRVPVRAAIYRVILPSGGNVEVTQAQPAAYHKDRTGQNDVFVFRQSPLSERHFRFAYRR